MCPIVRHAAGGPYRSHESSANQSQAIHSQGGSSVTGEIAGREKKSEDYVHQDTFTVGSEKEECAQAAQPRAAQRVHRWTCAQCFDWFIIWSLLCFWNLGQCRRVVNHSCSSASACDGARIIG